MTHRYIYVRAAIDLEFVELKSFHKPVTHKTKAGKTYLLHTNILKRFVFFSIQQRPQLPCGRWEEIVATKVTPTTLPRSETTIHTQCAINKQNKQSATHNIEGAFEITSFGLLDKTLYDCMQKSGSKILSCMHYFRPYLSDPNHP